MTRLARHLDLPAEAELVRELLEAAAASPPLALCLSAFETGRFELPDGTVEELGDVPISLVQAAALHHLARRCSTELSVEVGFGMGMSACVMLAARQARGEPFAHITFDPYGLEGGRGKAVQSYLTQQFADSFTLLEQPSELGLGQLLSSRGYGVSELIFIDGDHRFENVMIDFALASLLCTPGGYIVLDDAAYPAVETVVNYVTANRPDYAVAHLPVPNLSVLRKISHDEREWYAFNPFIVPNRRNWQARGETGAQALPSRDGAAGRLRRALGLKGRDQK
jgi:predicted O-methyltransferase YrrM